MRCSACMHRRAATTLMLLATAFVPVQVFGQGAPTLELSNFSGVWQETIHEDSYERSGGPPLGDYQGIPLNAAGRMDDARDVIEMFLTQDQDRANALAAIAAPPPPSALKDTEGKNVIQYVLDLPENMPPGKTFGLILCFPAHDRPVGDEIYPVRAALERHRGNPRVEREATEVLWVLSV